MIIKIPNNNIPERKYILDVVFIEFLGLDYQLEIISNDYEIILSNNKKLIIKDKFFNNYPNDLEYLKEENIPKSIKELDIFAACFFMLTRWEEYVNKTRDKHNRFPAYASLAYKEGLLSRPIVNEYVKELKKKLLELDETLLFKKREFKITLTHDVDAPLIHYSFIKHVKSSILDILQRKSIKLFCERNIDYIFTKLKLKNDAFDTFDYLMDISEKIGVKSYFFFMGKGVTSYDNMYNSSHPFIINLIQKIKDRGHYIGIHPTYDAYNNAIQFKQEKEELEKNLQTKIEFGREHYLRFEVPTTWQIWEDNKMKWDSTLSYADKEGFRCGVCYEFSVFNVITRKKLQLKEKPLIVMEGTFTTYQKEMLPEEMERKIVHLLEKVREYNGEFVFLWHNSSFRTNEWKKFANIYEKVLVS